MILTTEKLTIHAHEVNIPRSHRCSQSLKLVRNESYRVWYAGTRAKYLYARRHERSLGIQHFRITNKKAVNHLVGSLA